MGVKGDCVEIEGNFRLELDGRSVLGSSDAAVESDACVCVHVCACCDVIQCMIKL